MKLYTELIFKEKIDNYLIFEKIKKVIPFYKEKNFENDNTVETLEKSEYEKCITVIDKAILVNYCLSKILNIRKNYIVAQIDDSMSDERIHDNCSVEVMDGHASTQQYLYNKIKESNEMEWDVVANFSFLPDSKQVYVEDISINNAECDNDFDYLAMYSYLRERNCNDENMKLLELLYHINMYKYSGEHLLGMSKECLEYANEYIHNKRLLRLIKKGISISKKVNKKVSNNSFVKGKYNIKLHKAWLKYKKKDEIKIMLHNLMMWFVDNNKDFILEYNTESSALHKDIIEKITTHRLVEEAINSDIYIKNKGYDGEFPIYYKNENVCTQYIEFRFLKNSDDRPGIIETKTSIGIINKNEKYLNNNEPDFFDCNIGGIEINIGGVEKKKCKELDYNDVRKMQESLIDVSLSMFNKKRSKKDEINPDFILYNINLISSMRTCLSIVLIFTILFVGVCIFRIIIRLIVFTFVYFAKGVSRFDSLVEVLIENGIAISAIIVLLFIICFIDAIKDNNKFLKKVRKIKKIKYKNS